MISSLSKMDILVGDAEHVEVCLLIVESLPEYFNEAGLKEMRRNLLKDTLYVAVEGGCVVGFVTVNSEDGKAEIIWLAVAPEHQDEGVGRALVSRVKEDLIKNGVKLLTVKTLAEEADYSPFEATRRFYERNGFLHIETISNYPGWDGDPAAVYEKNLLSGA